MALIISRQVREKLNAKHQVSEREVRECIANRTGKFIADDREEHRSDPPTLWFIAETNLGRSLKIVFIYRDGNFVIRTAYSPEVEAVRIYNERGY